MKVSSLLILGLVLSVFANEIVPLEKPYSTPINSESSIITINKNNLSNLNSLISEAISKSENVKIYIPSGTYELKEPIRINVEKKDMNLSILGDGPELSKLIIKNNFGGILINFQTNGSFVSISNLTLLTGEPSSGDAVFISQPYKGNLHKRNAIIKDIYIANLYNSENFYFQNGIVLKGVWRPLIENVYITGFFGPKASQNPFDYLKMKTCLTLEDCYSPDVLNSAFWGAEIGIKINSSLLKGAAEGFRVANSKIVGNKIGILVDFLSKEPEGFITYNHLNNYFTNIYIKNRKFIYIVGNLIYRALKEGPSTDIVLENTNHSIITENVFHFPSRELDKERIIFKLINNSNFNLIHNNLITNQDATIYIEENSKGNIIEKNIQTPKTL